MENPATWSKATRIIQAALTEAHRQQTEGIIGFSTARIIHDALEREHLLAEGDGWIAVTERLPDWDGIKDYELVEAYSPAYGEYIGAVDAYWRGPCSAIFNGAHFIALTGTRLIDVTHWRLPAPPSGQGEVK